MMNQTKPRDCNERKKNFLFYVIAWTWMIQNPFVELELGTTDIRSNLDMARPVVPHEYCVHMFSTTLLVE